MLWPGRLIGRWEGLRFSQQEQNHWCAPCSTDRQIVVIVVICLDILFRIDLVLKTNTLVVARLAFVEMYPFVTAEHESSDFNNWPCIACLAHFANASRGSLWRLGEESGKLWTNLETYLRILRTLAHGRPWENNEVRVKWVKELGLSILVLDLAYWPKSLECD